MAADSLSGEQVGHLAEQNINYYALRDTVACLEAGVVAEGGYFDEAMYLDMLAADLRTAGINLLLSRRKVPQTELGVTSFHTVFAEVLDTYVGTGFVAPGVWGGASLFDLETGDMLPAGYRIFSDPVASQSAAERQARKAPNFYLAVKLAGAIQSVVIQVNINR